MTKTKNVHLDELYNFVVENFSLELIYPFKMCFEIYICQVQKNTQQRPLPSAIKTLGKDLCRVLFLALSKEALCQVPQKVSLLSVQRKNARQIT
jgi:hypothetical protein